MSILSNNPFIMKKQFVPLAVVFILAALIFSSCGKDDNVITLKTNTQLLTQGTWKFKSATIGGSDASASFQTCQKDNIMTFVAAGTGNVDEGTTKCSAGDPQTNSFSWNFQTSETILFISTTLFTGGNNTFTLVSLTETELILSQGISVGPGPIQLAVVTFIH
jgi:hypothetical protein